jgi:hypothetical protein
MDHVLLHATQRETLHCIQRCSPSSCGRICGLGVIQRGLYCPITGVPELIRSRIVAIPIRVSWIFRLVARVSDVPLSLIGSRHSY